MTKLVARRRGAEAKTLTVPPEVMAGDPGMSGVKAPHCRVCKVPAPDGYRAVQALDAAGVQVSLYVAREDLFDEATIELMRRQLHEKCCECRRMKVVK